MITRRIRAVLGIAVTWGVAFSALATTLLLGGLALGLVPSSIFGPREIMTVALRSFGAGALAGAIFATVLAGAERRNTLASLSTRRAAVWGFVGGVAIPMIGAAALGAMSLLPPGVLAAASIGYGAIGAAIAAGSVKLARRAPELAPRVDDQALPAPPQRAISSSPTDNE